jgi:hypothetical protein
MAREYAFAGDILAGTSPTAPAGIAPGKRSLTQGLMPVQRSLRDEQRAVADFDQGVGDDFYDQRATVEAAPSRELLTDRQIRTARRRNPHWIAKLGLSVQLFSNAEVDSSAFALDVAEKQAAAGLKIDGIAGPETAAQVAGTVAADRSTADAGRYGGDDPFGLHLVGGDKA